VTRISKHIRTRLVATGAAVVVAALALTGCSSSSNDTLANQYGKGTTQNYISGDGAITEIAVDKRTDPVQFSATASNGDSVTSAALKGKVVVLNFWYAGCPPCRAEAGYLTKASKQYRGKDVQFVGVNVRDEAGTAAAFERTYGVDYPTILDADKGTMQLALSGKVAPNSVPTTIILDKKGRVAARVLGAIDGPGILDTLVDDALTGKSA
jgi:thiol-disulfide isomerase/thioredoxin